MKSGYSFALLSIFASCCISLTCGLVVPSEPNKPSQKHSGLLQQGCRGPLRYSGSLLSAFTVSIICAWKWTRSAFKSNLWQAINFLSYVDRGLLNGILPSIGHDIGVSKTALGMLPAAYMAGYCLISPFCSTVYFRVDSDTFLGF